jgi:hypothetical protein
MTIDLKHSIYKPSDYERVFVNKDGDLSIQNAPSSGLTRFLPVPTMATKILERAGNYLFQWGSSPHAISSRIKSVAAETLKDLESKGSRPLSRREAAEALQEVKTLKRNLVNFDQYAQAYNQGSLLGPKSFVACPLHAEEVRRIQTVAHKLISELSEFDKNSFEALILQIDQNPSPLLQEISLVKLLRKYKALMDKGELSFEEVNIEEIVNKANRLFQIFHKVNLFTEHMEKEALKFGISLSADQKKEASLIYLVHVLQDLEFEPLLGSAPAEFQQFIDSMPLAVPSLESDLLVHWKLKAASSKVQDISSAIQAALTKLKSYDAKLAEKAEAYFVQAKPQGATYDQAELHKMIERIFINKPKNQATLETLVARIVQICDLLPEGIIISLLKKSDLIPTSMQLNHDLIGEKTVEDCVSSFRKFNDLCTWMMEAKNLEEPQWPEFEKQLAALPASLRPLVSEQYYKLCNERLLRAALRQLQHPVDEIPLMKSSRLVRALNRLQVPWQYRPVKLENVRASLSRFQDERWIATIPPARMKQMAVNCIESNILLQDGVYEFFKAKKGDAQFIANLYSELDPAVFGQICALMLINIPSEVTDKTLAALELHRILSAMLSHSKDLAQNLLKAKVSTGSKTDPLEVWIIPKERKLTDLEVFKELKGKHTSAIKGSRLWNDVRGIGGVYGIGVGEENLLGTAAPEFDPHPTGESIAVHELMHFIYTHGLTSGKAPSGEDLPAIRKEIKAMYEDKNSKIADYAKKAGVYVGWQYSSGKRHEEAYDATDDDEWVAMYAEAFFQTNGIPADKKISKEDLVSLGKEERHMFALFEKLFGKNITLDYCNPRTDSL